MTTELSPPSEDAGDLLEQAVEREQRALALLRKNGTLFERLRQRWRLRRAEQTALWQETRELGYSHFVWRQGILEFGFGMFLTMEVMIPIARGRFPGTLGEIGASLLAGAVAWIAGGWLVGVWAWSDGEVRHEQRLQALRREESVLKEVGRGGGADV